MRHERREKQKAESRNMSKNREEFSSFGFYWLFDSCVFVCSNSALELKGGHYGHSPGKFSLGGETPRANPARACSGRETLYHSFSLLLSASGETSNVWVKYAAAKFPPIPPGI